MSICAMTSGITDPEILAFIAEVDGLTPPGTVVATIAEQRALYDAMSAYFRAPRPQGLSVRDASIARVPCRIYEGGSRGQIVFLHGGGFVVGGLDSHDDVAAEIAVATQASVTAVDYRLAPEHLHPAAFDDALAVTRAIAAPVVLVGDSAGGTLAASVAWTLRGQRSVAGQVLIYPSLGGLALDLPSYTDCAGAPLLTTADIHAYGGLRTGGAPDDTDPTQRVLAAIDHIGTAPTFISAAGVDPLRDDGLAYRDRLLAAGSQAECWIEEQLPHMWLRARHRTARGAAAFERVLDAVKRLIAR
ncbi:MAG: alpha/beta hydrolase [Pseudomonadota bacterium]